MVQPSEITDLTSRLPTKDEITSAAEAAEALARARTGDGELSLGADHDVTLAPAVADLLISLLGHVAEGHMVTLVPTGALLTTQQAADILNVSRPHLSKMLKEDIIPHVKVGTHRRVRHADLEAYRTQRDSTRKRALDRLAKLGQEFDAS